MAATITTSLLKSLKQEVATADQPPLSKVQITASKQPAMATTTTTTKAKAAPKTNRKAATILTSQ